MKRIMVVVVMVGLGMAICCAEDAPPPAAGGGTAPGTGTAPVLTIETITRYPRSVDTMARLWIALYQACQAAGVPAESVSVLPRQLPDAVNRVYTVIPPKVVSAKVQARMESEQIVCVVSPETMGKLVPALVPVAGVPRVYMAGPNLYAGWIWKGAWPGDWDKVPEELLRWEGQEPRWRVVRLFVVTQANQFTPPLLELVAKYGKQ